MFDVDLRVAKEIFCPFLDLTAVLFFGFVRMTWYDRMPVGKTHASCRFLRTAQEGGHCVTQGDHSSFGGVSICVIDEDTFDKIAENDNEQKHETALHLTARRSGLRKGILNPQRPRSSWSTTTTRV